MLNEFIAYLESKVGKSIYVWGGQGEKGNQITEAWIRKRETSTENANRAITFWNKLKKGMNPAEIEAYDCSGLGVHYIFDIKRWIKADTTAHGLMNMCTRITRDQIKRGDWAFKVNSSGRATHIGYITDDKLNIVESKGREHGVIKSPVNSTWNAFGRPPFFKDEIEKGAAQAPAAKPTSPNPAAAPSKPSGTFTRLLKLTAPMMRGEDVKLLQALLNKRGYAAGKEDGVFGAGTKKAVMAFQKANGLAQDGIVGKNSACKLGVTWRG